MPRKKKEKQYLSWEMSVAGTNYHQAELMELAFRNIEAPPEEGSATIDVYHFVESPVELVPDPKNEYDKNAIKVIVNKHWVGFIPAANCLEVKSLLKNCDVEYISCRIDGGTKVSWEDRKVIYSQEKIITAKVRIGYVVRAVAER